MRNRLVIVGASGHGKVVADVAIKSGYTEIVFADDDAKGRCLDFPIVCSTAELQEQNDGKTAFVVAIGNNEIRKRIVNQHQNLNWATLIHPSATVGICVKIGKGSVVMAGAVINACATVGEHCIINTCAVVEHDNVIENYAHISPNASLGGSVCVREGTHIGIGAVVKNNVTICKNCTIGAGAVVVKDIKESATYIGVPAKNRRGG